MLTFAVEVGLRGSGPSICMYMQTAAVERLVRCWLESYCAAKGEEASADFFVVSVRVRRDKIEVLVDRDAGIGLEECAEISRGLSGMLEEQGVDMELEVSSPGLTTPFAHPRQYAKYMGQWVEVMGVVDRRWHEGILRGYAEGALELEESVLVLGPGGKRKHSEEQVTHWAAGSYSACRLSWDKIGRGDE